MYDYENFRQDLEYYIALNFVDEVKPFKPKYEDRRQGYPVKRFELHDKPREVCYSPRRQNYSNKISGTALILNINAIIASHKIKIETFNDMLWDLVKRAEKKG